MIKAVIFDMDGLLVDSEPLWEKAESNEFNKIGVPLTLEMTKQTMGYRVDEVVEYWFNRYPWKGISHQEVQANIISEVIRLIKEEGMPKQGVKEIIHFFTSRNIPMAVASSSYSDIINAVLDKLHLTKSFKVVCSAEHEEYGKPNPGVFLSAAKRLNLQPEYCLVFEDSPNGVLAAKAAKMKCVAVPDEKMRDDKRFCIADIAINSLNEFNEAVFQKFIK